MRRWVIAACAAVALLIATGCAKYDETTVYCKYANGTYNAEVIMKHDDGQPRERAIEDALTQACEQIGQSFPTEK